MRVLALHLELVRMAWRNVLRNWRHSMATILAIASGFMAVSLFDGFLRELRYRIDDGYGKRGMFGQVIVQREGAQEYLEEDPWKYALDQRDQQFLNGFFAEDPAFVRQVRFLHVRGMASAGRNSAVFLGFGYDIEEGRKTRGERWEWDAVAGVPLHVAQEPGLLIGTGLGMLLDCHAEPTGDFILPDGNYVPEERPFTCKYPRITLSATTEYAQVNTIDLNVVGLMDSGFRETNKRILRLPLAEAQRLLDTDKLTMVAVELESPAETQGFIKRLENAAREAGLKLEVQPWLDHSIASYVRGGLDLLAVFRNLFMVVVVTICVMAVANTMMKSVHERISEIGTLRSLGFLGREIIVIFAFEGLFISLLACAGGFVMTLMASELVGSLGIKYRAGVLSTPIALDIRPAPMAWVWSTVILVALATGTSLWCSRRAARMVVADALRHS